MHVHRVARKPHGVGFHGHVLEYEVALGRLHEPMGVLGQRAPRNVLVDEVRPDEARALVGGRDPLDEIEARQIEPSVVVRTHLLVHEKDHLGDVGWGVKVDIEFLRPIGSTRVEAHDRQLADPGAALLVRDRHLDTSAPVRPEVVRCMVGLPDDLVHRRLGRAPRRGQGRNQDGETGDGK